MLALTLLTGLLGPLAPAWAAEPLIEKLTERPGGLDIVLTETDLPPGVSPPDASVTVTVAGQVARTTVTATGEQQQSTAQRTVVLVFDTSGSMRGARLQEAQRAGAQLLRDLPADVRVGLVRFSNDVAVLAAPTLDRAAVSTALAGLQAGGRTRLYDALPVALTAAGAAGERRLVVLSDGEDDDDSSSSSSDDAGIPRDASNE